MAISELELVGREKKIRKKIRHEASSLQFLRDWWFFVADFLIAHRRLTYWVSDCHDDRVPGVLDEVDDVAVVHAGNVDVVDRQDPVTHVEPTAPLGRRPGDYPTDRWTGLPERQKQIITILNLLKVCLFNSHNKSKLSLEA